MSLPTGTIPAALDKGAIAFISPSSRVNKLFPKRIERATAWLQSQGHETKEIFNTIPKDAAHIDIVKSRCEEIHQAFADPKVKAIICTIGGFSANELLRHLDYDLIRQNPKAFSGHSDITLLHHALFVKAGLRTFYGPAVITDFGEFPQPDTFTMDNFFKVTNADFEGPVPRSNAFTQEFLDWTTDESNQRPRKHEPAPPWKWLRSGRAKGRLYGGCLPSMNQIKNTEWFPDYTGKILLLETPEGDSAPDAVFTPEAARLALCDLRNSGLLDRISGIVVGRPLFYTAQMREEFEKMLVDQTHGLDIPILANIDIGHTSPALTIPLNAMAELNSELDSFKFLAD